jgi:hypothetical protein
MTSAGSASDGYNGVAVACELCNFVLICDVNSPSDFDLADLKYCECIKIKLEQTPSNE